MQGYLQVYTGNGKGKTTAAVGLAIRAAGAGLKVLFAQFVKGRKYSEIGILEGMSDHLTVRQYGRGCFIGRKADINDIEAATKGLAEVEAYVKTGTFDVIILDEACIALHYSLFTFEDLSKIITSRPSCCEMVITGRFAPAALIASADLVTEMKDVKHYYDKGVAARDGIER